jgi:glycine/D-amino acid oxidase-like deaminating enzyme
MRQGVEVTDFKKQGRRIVEVVTTGGSYKAENIILATGMWSRELGQKLGIRIPACAVEHQYIVTEVNWVRSFKLSYFTRSREARLLQNQMLVVV